MVLIVGFEPTFSWLQNKGLIQFSYISIFVIGTPRKNWTFVFQLSADCSTIELPEYISTFLIWSSEKELNFRLPLIKRLLYHWATRGYFYFKDFIVTVYTLCTWWTHQVSNLDLPGKSRLLHHQSFRSLRWCTWKDLNFHFSA